MAIVGSSRPAHRGRWAVAVVAALGWCAVALAAAPDRLVRDTTQALLDVIERERDALQAQPERLYEYVRAIVLPHFDRDRICRWVLGRHGRDADPAQRARFCDLLEDRLIRIYSARLLDVQAVRIEYEPAEIRPDGRQARVATRVSADAQAPVRVEYVLFSDGDTWRVGDVVIEGVSAVLTFRNDFSEEIRRHGLAAFLDRLERGEVPIPEGVGAAGATRAPRDVHAGRD